MSTEGHEPARGSLDGVIHSATDEISSRLEQIHDRYCALGAQESAEALENVNGFAHSCFIPCLQCCSWQMEAASLESTSIGEKSSSRAWILLRYSLALKNSRREKEKNSVAKEFFTGTQARSEQKSPT